MNSQKIEQAAEELMWASLPLGQCLEYRVVSASMRYLIDDGDRVTVKRVGESELAVGDIIVFRSPDARYPRPMIHRIVRKEKAGDEYRYFTKGDYNRRPDLVPIRYPEVFGKVVAVKKAKWGITLRVERRFGRLVSRCIGAVTERVSGILQWHLYPKETRLR